MANMPTPVQLAPPARTPGGLLEAARPLPGGWERGVSWLGTQCVPTFSTGECPEGDFKPTGEPSLSSWSPYQVGTALECEMRGVPDLDGLANGALDGALDYAVTRELATGEASNRDGGANPSLVGSVTEDLGDATDAVTALACLEQAAAVALFGRLAYIHVKPMIATHLLSGRAIWRDGTRWRTAYGSTVVIGAGYTGLDVDVQTGTIWGTGEVWAATGQRDTLTSTDRSTNVGESRAEQVALAVFDPCWVAAVGTGLAC